MPNLQSDGCRDEFATIPQADGGFNGEDVRCTSDSTYHPSGDIVYELVVPRGLVFCITHALLLLEFIFYLIINDLNKMLFNGRTKIVISLEIFFIFFCRNQKYIYICTVKQ